MADQRLPASFWQQLIQHSLLSLYTVPKVQLAGPEYLQDYDFVFEFSDSIIYLLVSDVIKREHKQQIDAPLIRTWRKELANQTIKRHSQLYYEHDESSVQTDTTSNGKAVYFVGLTALWIKYLDEGQEDRSHTVEHEYGTQFFTEDCVLDLDDEQSILQIFSYQNFMKLLNKLYTPSDLVVFLQFHRRNLADLKPFIDETALFEQFLQAPDIHYKAIEVQEHLVKAEIMNEVEPRLLKAVAAQQSHFARTLVEETYQYTEIWNKLLDSLIKRHHEADLPLLQEQIKIIVDESTYTHRRLVEDILAHKNTDEAARWNGYATHQHSYSKVGRHYMLVFYAEDESSALHANNIRTNYQDLLANLNWQLQSPVMDDLFLIGVAYDSDNINDIGNDTKVGIDVYYQGGVFIN